MKTYTCPMHPEVTSQKPGRCPKCGMKLVPSSLSFPRKRESKREILDQVENDKVEFSTSSNNNSYAPLFIIIGIIFIASFTVSFSNGFNMQNLIKNFMAGFFLVFSAFKLIDLKGFAQGYSTYDLLAKKVFAYGYIYPFIELFFGLAMITNVAVRPILFAELIVMSFSGFGVAAKLIKGEKFQCVCLGTFLKVPLTYVTLIEDFGMAALALLLLVIPAKAGI